MSSVWSRIENSVYVVISVAGGADGAARGGGVPGDALLADCGRPVVGLVGPDVAQVGDDLFGEEVGVLAGDLLAQVADVRRGDELADAQLGHQLADALADGLRAAGDDEAPLVVL